MEELSSPDEEALLFFSQSRLEIRRRSVSYSKSSVEILLEFSDAGDSDVVDETHHSLHLDEGSSTRDNVVVATIVKDIGDSDLTLVLIVESVWH